MRDVTGAGANKNGVPIRPDQSTEHPKSGLPLHDLTGGNAWISQILASLDPGSTAYDPVNVQILDKGPAVPTLDLNAGQSPKTNGDALQAGAERACQAYTYNAMRSPCLFLLRTSLYCISDLRTGMCKKS